MAAYTTIDDPEKYFQAVTYTGNGSTQSITLPGDSDMQPDMVWFKRRDDTDSHKLIDAARGVTKRIIPDTNSAEVDDDDVLTAFNSDGFSVGDDDSSNASSASHVAWCWKANGSGSSDTTGTINSTKTSANTTSGFSIVTYSGNATDEATVGHGLGTAPKLLIGKATGSTEDWTVWHQDMTSIEYYLVLATQVAQADANGAILHALPTTSVFSLGSDSRNNGSGVANVFYLWSEVQGYSKFGTYTSNGSATNGPFIYTGFRPAFTMIKMTNGTNPWVIDDNTRSPYNVMKNTLQADNTNTELTGYGIDYLSNGFKIYTNDSSYNGSATNTFIYMAFAEAPFVNSNGVPCNAR